MSEEDDIQAQFTNVVRDELRRHARAAVADVRCPVHGPAAKEVHVVYTGGEEGDISVTACCSAMDEEINRALSKMDGD